MAAAYTGQTRVVPLQNVAYDMSQRINYVLTVKCPQSQESTRVRRSLGRTLHWERRVGLKERGDVV